MDNRFKVTAIVGFVLLAGVWAWSLLEGASPPAGGGDVESRAARQPSSDAQGPDGIAARPAAQDAKREPFDPRAAEADPTAGIVTGSLRVKVIYGDDESPASDIGIQYHRAEAPGDRVRWREARTDAHGELRVAGLPPGKITVYPMHRMDRNEKATIVAGEEADVRFTLNDGIDIKGVVVDTAGTPVAGATIVLLGSHRPEVVAGADSDGRFSLRQCERMSNIGARAKGYAPSPLRTITAGEGAKVDVRIVLPGAGGSVVGSVLDPDGQPVAGASVIVGVGTRIITLPDGARGRSAPAFRLETDAAGQFAAVGLAPGKVPVGVRALEFPNWSGVVDVTSHRDVGLVIHLARGFTCEGIVRDENGAPVQTVEVAGGSAGSKQRRSTHTAADGSYRLAGLVPGKLAVTAFRPKQGTASTELHGTAGQVVRWDVKLSRGIVLLGIARGRGGNPLGGVRVEGSGRNPRERRTWSGRRSWYGSAVTAKDGTFELIDCPKGPVIHLRLECAGYADLDRLKLDASAGALDLRMRWEGAATARITGRILDPDGKAVGAARIRASRRGDSSSRPRTADAAGNIDVRDLRPGLYRVWVKVGAWPEFTSDFKMLASGETWDLGSVQLVRGGRVRVRQQIPNGREKDLVVLVIYRDGLWYSRIDTSKQPLISDPIPQGAAELRISGPSVVPATLPFTVRVDQELELPVSIQFGNPRFLRFELPAGTDDVRSLEFTLTRHGGFRHTRLITRWRPSPFMVRMGLLEGRYTVRATTPSGLAGELGFEVRDADGTVMKRQTIRVALR